MSTTDPLPPPPSPLDGLAAAAKTLGPKSAAFDGQSAEAHPLPDLIAADRYGRATAAAAAGGTGIRFLRIIPPGAV